MDRLTTRVRRALRRALRPSTHLRAHRVTRDSESMRVRPFVRLKGHSQPLRSSERRDRRIRCEHRSGCVTQIVDPDGRGDDDVPRADGRTSPLSANSRRERGASEIAGTVPDAKTCDGTGSSSAGTASARRSSVVQSSDRSSGSMTTSRRPSSRSSPCRRSCHASPSGGLSASLSDAADAPAGSRRPRRSASLSRSSARSCRADRDTVRRVQHRV